MVTAAATDCLSVVRRFDPTWQYKVNQYQRRWHYQGLCPTGHDTNTPSFYISRDLGHWWCFGACNGHGNAQDLLQLLSGVSLTYASAVSKPPPAAPKTKPGKERLLGVTIKALCLAKGLDEQFVTGFLSWRDASWREKDANGQWYKVPAVEMPYPDENNQNHLARFRVSASQGDKYRWGPRQQLKDRVVLYGLWTLGWIRQQGWVILVEGETDFATLLYHNYPVIGVPGASNWREQYAHLFQGVQVYVWQEPGEAAEKFARSVAQDISNLRVIHAPQEAKDPCELAQQLGDQFTQRMDELVQNAEPWWQPPAQSTSAAWTPYDELEDRLQLPRWEKKLLSLIRWKCMEGYKAVGDYKSAGKLKVCFSQMRFRLWEDGNIEGIRHHCFIRPCPNCVYLKMAQFIEEKREAFDNLKDPVVYQVTLGAQEVGTDTKTMWDRIPQVYSAMRTMLKEYRESFRDVSSVAGDHIYNLRAVLRNGWMAGQLVFLANYEARAKMDLEVFFSKATGLPAKVTVWGLRHINDDDKRLDATLEYFKKLVATEILWDTTDEFQAWKHASKGMKLVQGVGVFKKAAGGMNAKGTEDEYTYGAGTNPYTGRFEGWYYTGQSLPEEEWEEFDSLHTGRKHWKLKPHVDPDTVPKSDPTLFDDF